MTPEERAELKMAVWRALNDADHLPGSLSEKADRISNDVCDNLGALLAAKREACAVICDEEHLAAGYEPGGAKVAADRIRSMDDTP